jgi:hypothetical protein
MTLWEAVDEAIDRRNAGEENDAWFLSFDYPLRKKANIYVNDSVLEYATRNEENRLTICSAIDYFCRAEKGYQPRRTKGRGKA